LIPDFVSLSKDMLAQLDQVTCNRDNDGSQPIYDAIALITRKTKWRHDPKVVVIITDATSMDLSFNTNIENGITDGQSLKLYLCENHVRLVIFGTESPAYKFLNELPKAFICQINNFTDTCKELDLKNILDMGHFCTHNPSVSDLIF
jgi:hypothetical protein